MPDEINIVVSIKINNIPDVNSCRVFLTVKLQIKNVFSSCEVVFLWRELFFWEEDGANFH